MKHGGHTYKIRAIIVLIIALITLPVTAQEVIAVAANDSLANVETHSPLHPAAMDSTYRNMTFKSPIVPSDSSFTQRRANEIKIKKPDPMKATWLALIIPGGGQIYNKKFWKLPIVYGGFVGCLYAYNWNGQMYKDYRQAYLDIMDSDPNTDSFKDFFRPGFNFEANEDYLKKIFKRRKDRYRRWRDLSIFSFIGVYAISVIDAYVDAQLSSFDITEDINLSIEPQKIQGGNNLLNDNYYGLNFNLSF